MRTTGAAYYTDVRRAWDLDSTTHRIIPVRTDGVRCRNTGWSSPLPAAAPELEAAALTFAPTRRMARIYVYQASVTDLRPPVVFTIAIDSQTVGRTASGTYLMAEVEPGPHWVSAPGEKESAVSLHAAADSAYFVKLWHKRGLRGSGFGGMKRIEPVEGRAVIPTAQMVPSRRSRLRPQRFSAWLTHHVPCDPAWCFQQDGSAMTPTFSAASAAPHPSRD